MNDLYLQSLTAVNMEILEVDHIILDASEWVADGIISPYTRIYLVTEGIGYISSENESYTMTPGNVYVIPAGCPLYYRCESGFKKIYFHISLRRNGGPDIFEAVDKLLTFSDEVSIKRLKKCFPIDSVSKAMEIKSYIYSVICRCLSQSKDPSIGSYSDNMTEILRYIDANLSCSLTVDKISEALFISPAKIRKVFRTEMDTSVGKYIDDCIMLAAEQEVRSSDVSIHEISGRLGFCDQFYFSRCFSKKFGMSPQQYRKAHRTKGITG